ncbi:23S rRNA (guanosine(2251)-2'-O)-methyltransferase RlmB [Anaerococcus sp. AGMB00486]|uniref:23S rRNA (Guanosine(2251)-2'-O)-methyltransferase RlmB n=2 Tax=Anaerococcus TaxID=165779 RepID=A0ABX2N8Z3_9FIRM|nr:MULTISPECIES: 23S rRNA (guanosine(2251)-2'-O)-methyltransferase RlmB [Anaerococcus]MDY3005758.1 23S rRNA (guanosine(2251)-2'-O)-methyltransferase RlmB [Anaerococcus porci]MSS77471.1 23S rRNA (guanosine(2251)-2'-O)-methyltransferase RlmB [Anaerococcus porci]NVF11139.1 23S rRNA (guanosine(2251)-2'-O)-methyltransferase RlmB [Anaerococcus faecalis]
MAKIFGRKPVIETIDTGEKILKAHILKSNSNNKFIEKIINKLNERNVKIVYENKDYFSKIDGNHQGVEIEVEDFKYKDLDELKDKKRLMILDQIEDPHNLGAIIRSAEAFGFDGIIIGERRSAKVNSTVYKTSAGAINNIDIAQVININRAIKELKEENFWIYGLAGEAESDITQTDLTGKIGLVVGNEGKGLSRLVRENCDGLIKIPMLGKINSLNASVASAIAIYETIRQNGFN